MKIPDKQELQQIAFNHSSDIDFKDFMNRLMQDNPLRFRKNLLERI